MTALSIESTSLHRVAAVPSSSDSAGEASSAWLTLRLAQATRKAPRQSPLVRAIRRRSDEPAIAYMHRIDALTTQLAAASTFDSLSDGWMCPERPSAGSQIMSSNARSGASEHQGPLHYMPASCARGGEGSRRTFRLRLMSPRAYRDREAKVSLLQRCRSGGRRRLTAPMLCTGAWAVVSGWGLHGMVFSGRRGLTNACV